MRRYIKNLRATHPHTGFAMLFTVLVMTLILSIALGISNITYKQTILSSLAKDSEVAFYQADAGVECALYYDLSTTQRAFNGTNPVPGSITCGTASLSGGQTQPNYYEYTSAANGAPCIAAITIDKRSSPVVIQARGNNICQSNPRQVERALEVRYIP